MWSDLANEIMWIELAYKMTIIGLSNDRYLMSRQSLCLQSWLFPPANHLLCFPSLWLMFFGGSGGGESESLELLLPGTDKRHLLLSFPLSGRLAPTAFMLRTARTNYHSPPSPCFSGPLCGPPIRTALIWLSRVSPATEIGGISVWSPCSPTWDGELILTSSRRQPTFHKHLLWGMCVCV